MEKLKCGCGGEIEIKVGLTVRDFNPFALLSCSKCKIEFHYTGTKHALGDTQFYDEENKAEAIAAFKKATRIDRHDELVGALEAARKELYELYGGEVSDGIVGLLFDKIDKALKGKK
jgi:hypothetical protein